VKRSAGKGKASRRAKRGSPRIGPPHAATWLALGLALLSALGHTASWWWLGAVLRELSIWLGGVALAVGLVQALRRHWPSAAIAGAAAASALAPLAPYVLGERPTPVHGPTVHVHHYHLGRSAPRRDLLQALLGALQRRRDVDLLSFTADGPGVLTSLAAPAGFRKLAARGEGERVLFVRGLAAGSGPSTVRVGSCSLALEQVSLPSLFDLPRQKTRAERLAALPRTPSHQPSVWFGHLGSSPAAVDVQPVARAQDMRDARVRHALLGTFPALFGPLGLSLDPVLVHGWIAVRALETLPAELGAPYRGVHAELELTEPRCARPTRS
jgi:hypothetical protein